MKCPKCSYLGFETGDRCKNCGYDFSLLAAPAEPPDPDLVIHVPDHMPSRSESSWMDRLHSGVEDVAEAHEMPEPAFSGSASAPPAPHETQPRADVVYPLFSPADDNDEPLIKMPSAPRAPLSVRRTPEQPRLRPPSRDREDSGLALEFAEDAIVTEAPVATRSFEPSVSADTEAPASGLVRRVAAGLTDHAILLGIDVVVVYSTLRMAALTMGDWQQLPALPLLTFLALLKLAYFGAFTAACGQTIGKMATGIRVVADDAPLDPARAARRTIMAAFSVLAFGAGFIPAFLDPDRRALHDRLARTRVVELPSV
jgi:uncharacterized RDD family membrane protein YckC